MGLLCAWSLWLAPWLVPWLAPVASAAVDVSPWYGRSIYFIVIDRFAFTDTDYGKQCGVLEDKSTMIWCGGTIKGIIRKLDYIQDMGFDAIWITPVVKQTPWKDKYNGTGYHGYWAQDFHQIEPRYGNEQDLLDLSRACKQRLMLFMLDVVANHVGPIHNLSQVSQMGPPLNDLGGDQFHQLSRKADQTFEDYLKHPLEAYVNIPDVFTGRIKYSCWTGNYSCFPEYSERQILNGWFGDLGDLNQENYVVRSYLLQWIKDMVKKYEIDGIRLDTAAYIPMDFLAEFQESAGVFVIGEVVTYNMSYHMSFQHSLRGLLNFPLSLQWTPFPDNEMSNDVWRSIGSFVRFNELLKAQLHGNYTDLHLLGNFIDNHDTMRFAYTHVGDDTMVENALTFVFLWHGIPIFYYGTENPGVSETVEERKSMWMPQSNVTGDAEAYAQTDAYFFTKRLNEIRNFYGLSPGGKHVMEAAKVIMASHHMLAFTRGDILIVVTDGGMGTSPQTCFSRDKLPPEIAYGCIGLGVHDVLSNGYRRGGVAKCISSGLCITMDGSHPAIFAAMGKLGEESKSLFALGLGAGIFIPTVAYYYWQGSKSPRSVLDEDASE